MHVVDVITFFKLRISYINKNFEDEKYRTERNKIAQQTHVVRSKVKKLFQKIQAIIHNI